MRLLAHPQGYESQAQSGKKVVRWLGSSPARTDASSPAVDVSVIIPVYNTEEWLDDCLVGALTQTGVAVEVICVDDGSFDSSGSILARYAERDARVRVIRQTNSGQSIARNAGIHAARGRYLVFLDSDDFWPVDGLARLVSLADREDLDVLLFDAAAFRDADVPEDVWRRYENYYLRSRAYRSPRPGSQMIADMRRNEDYRPHVGLYVARTEHVRSAGVRFIPEIVHQDNPFTFDLLLSAERVAHTRFCFYARRLRGGSTITALRAAASARGYFLSYVSMREARARHVFAPASAAMIDEVVGGVFESAGTQFQNLDQAALDEIELSALTFEARAAFTRLRSLAHRAEGESEENARDGML